MVEVRGYCFARGRPGLPKRQASVRGRSAKRSLTLRILAPSLCGGSTGPRARGKNGASGSPLPFLEQAPQLEAGLVRRRRKVGPTQGLLSRRLPRPIVGPTQGQKVGPTQGLQNKKNKKGRHDRASVDRAESMARRAEERSTMTDQFIFDLQPPQPAPDKAARQAERLRNLKARYGRKAALPATSSASRPSGERPQPRPGRSGSASCASERWQRVAGATTGTKHSVGSPRGGTIAPGRAKEEALLNHDLQRSTQREPTRRRRRGCATSIFRDGRVTLPHPRQTAR